MARSPKRDGAALAAEREGAALPQVSVAMIAYQQVNFIGEALQSLVDQDYPNLQIVVSDDGSTDGTAEEIARFAKLYPDKIVALIDHERLGITGNSNHALRSCTGKYVCFLGGDDVFLPGKVSRQVEWFEERPERVLCGHQVEVFYQDGSRRPHLFQRMLRHGWGAAKAIRYGTFAACSVMVRADKIPPHGFEEQLPTVSDYMLWIEVLANGGEFGFIPGVWARYRRHDSNISSNIPLNVADIVLALQIIEERYPQYARECRQARARFLHCRMGTHFLQRRERAEARSEFLKALSVEPTYPRAWIGLVKSLVPS